MTGSLSNALYSIDLSQQICIFDIDTSKAIFKGELVGFDYDLSDYLFLTLTAHGNIIYVNVYKNG